MQGGLIVTAGTTIPGKAARHKALREGSRRNEAARLRADLAALGTQAHQHDAADEAALGRRRGEELPAAWARRDDRVATMEAAMRPLAVRATADAEAERPRRAAVEAERPRLGSPRRGKAPTPVAETPDAKAPTTCTAPAWQLRRPTNTGWEYGGQAPARGEAASQLRGACDVTTASHAPQHAEPRARMPGPPRAPAGRVRPTDAPGAAPQMPATSDSGAASAAAAAAVAQRGCEPSRAPGRQRHPASEAEAMAPPAPATERLAAPGRTPTGRAWDARRTVIVAPGCGQRKEARGFRRFLWRGLDHIRGAWPRVWVPPHLLTLWRYTCAPSTVASEAIAFYGPAMALGKGACRLCTDHVPPKPTRFQRSGHSVCTGGLAHQGSTG